MLSNLALLLASGTLAIACDELPIASWSYDGPPPFQYQTASWDPKVFHKLGGFSPWFPSTGVYGVPGYPGQVPDGCSVDQVQVYMRHAEREASGGTARGIAALVKKLANSTFQSSDPNIQYLQTWNYSYPAEYLSPLGYSDATAAGVAFQHAYSPLLGASFYFNNTGPKIPIRSTDQERVNATANAFAAGMMGFNYSAFSNWLVTPDSSTTFNSTLASNNCPAVNTIDSTANGIFNSYFQPLVRDRLAPLMPGFNLTTNDVGSLMNACPFDSFNRLSPSPICSIFTPEEWLGYNYAYDLNQFDNAGYGGPIGTAWGVGWVAEMIARLNDSAVIPVGSVNTTLDSNPATFPLNSSVYLDFTHDTSLESSLTAMGLFKADYNGNVTLDQIDPNRAWQSALISPMGGRLFVERLQCQSTGNQSTYPFVRMLLNSAVVPLYTLTECNHSWGANQGLCELPLFLESQTFALNGANFSNCYNNYTNVPL
ncbi:histidine phosphatase superfamily [Kockovaella imperatae]|uniref:Histidine phosphatase superfamily n=1 Tax=Kockovaella imperatae TaxID=4999 RepID=A0A1Y1UA77_9TREE|nr:histidine phosphatase superfamily [Kockovaella imperatae]ORX34928.1 histidine phosphatase superfamily [Kockovaella imperatae]